MMVVLGVEWWCSGSAFVRGSGITYTSDGNSSLSDVTYMSHTFINKLMDMMVMEQIIGCW